MSENSKAQGENSGWDSLPDDIKKSLLMQVSKEMALVADHSRLLVLIAHGFVELLVNTLIDHHLKNSKKILKDNRSYPHATKLLVLNELGIVDDHFYQILDWFRRLRNEAAHRPIFAITEADLAALKVEKFRDPKNFFSFCMNLVGAFWNQHSEIFSPKYGPALSESANEP
jgi:hypothetical protein